MNIKLSRMQELRLIQIGLDQLLAGRTERIPWNKGRKTAKKKWSPQQRDKFRKTMKKIWAEKKKGTE